jgi:hypothetical protein
MQVSQMTLALLTSVHSTSDAPELVKLPEMNEFCNKTKCSVNTSTSYDTLPHALEK